MTGRICEFEPCEEPHSCKGLCAIHYNQLRKRKDRSLLTPIGSQSVQWTDESAQLWVQEHRPYFQPSEPFSKKIAKWKGLCTNPLHPASASRNVSPSLDSMMNRNTGHCTPCGTVQQASTKASQNQEQCRTVAESSPVGYRVRSFEVRPLRRGENVSWILYTCYRNHDNEMMVNNFNKGARCPDCADYGFNPQAPAVFYCLGNDSWIKCGKANNSNLANRLQVHAAQGLMPLSPYRQFQTGAEATTREKEWTEFLKTVPIEDRPSKEDIPDGYKEAVRNRDLYLRHALILTEAKTV